MKKLFLFIFLFLPIWAHSKAIIFDLGGVLVSSSKTKIARNIGLGSFISYFFKQGDGPENIFNLVMDILDTIEPAIATDNEPFAYLSGKKIRRLPTLYCKWLAGKAKSSEIKQAALKEVEKRSKEKRFSHKIEKKLTIKTINSMFNPQLIARATKRIKRGMNLVSDLKAKGHDLYILSNWDNESFNTLCNNSKNKELFKLFKKEHILISGQLGDYKPHQSIFQTLIKRFNLDVKDCVFIDDQEENIAAAKSIGIQAFHLPHKCYKELRIELKRERIL